MPLATLVVATAFAAASAPAVPGPSQPERTRIATPATIEDIPCAAGNVWRWPGGRLQQCTLDRDATVRGAALPKGAMVSFDADGTHDVVFLPRTTAIEGYQCRGGGNNFMTRFHPDGRLKLCWIPGDAVIQGVPCSGFAFWGDVVRRTPSGVEFHPDGTLAACRVSRDVTIQGMTIRNGHRIRLDPKGRVVSSGRP